MKYRLKKDLPFAKAGAEVHLFPENLLYKRLALFNDGTYPYCIVGSDEIDLWIEEIKPREFYVTIFPNEQINVYHTKHIAELNDGGVKFETIKVVEV